MILTFDIAHAVIDFMVIENKIMLIIIDAMVVALNTGDITNDMMQSAIDVRPVATNLNATQPNYDHRNRVIAFSHLIFVF